ncbi:MAG: oligosaccharide flippase family protein [Clostridia bacterium]|nr:oligosaccharide flippase family protein [Clostridia bacterium]MBQ8893208.1 oligosaccharide flippase family protein [Clostridia bacterium]
MKKLDFSNNKRGVLFKNTLMLYILQASTALLAVAVAPYQSRVLGPEVFGGIFKASAAIIVYFQLIIDFGFMLSATEEVSLERENKGRLQEIFTSVTLSKLGLAVISFALLMILSSVIPAWEHKKTVLILTFFATLLNSMIPDYLYRGLEKMTAITIRTVLIKVFFTVATFLFLKGPEDVWVIPTLNIIGNGVALIAAYVHVYKALGIGFVKPRLAAIWREFKKSSVFFYSRIATTAYTALNTVILDIITGSGSDTGFYTSANQLIETGKTAVSPISDSFYPYMTKNKDFKLLKKVLLLIEPVIFVFCAVVFVFAKEFCVLFFGPEYAAAGDVLRAMLPVGVVILPSYLLGFPTLTAMGKTKHANYSTIFGSVLQFLMLGLMFLTDHVNMITLALTVSITETAILAYRIVIVVKNRHLMKKEN